MLSMTISFCCVVIYSVYGFSTWLKARGLPIIPLRLCFCLTITRVYKYKVKTPKGRNSNPTINQKQAIPI
ncbi:hypothetical protein L1887_34347 [Cichorium endivia]|nr:hypothetical protein L1887_34347 [Cichorium endivia]